MREIKFSEIKSSDERKILTVLHKYYPGCKIYGTLTAELSLGWTKLTGDNYKTTMYEILTGKRGVASKEVYAELSQIFGYAYDNADDEGSARFLYTIEDDIDNDSDDDDHIYVDMDAIL